MPPARIATRWVVSIVLVLSLTLQTGTWIGAPEGPPAQNLATRIRAVLTSSCLEPSKTGVQVIALKDGSEVFAQNPDTALKPASNQKLFTSAAALSLLKPDHVFPTLFYSTKPVRDGILDADLYIKGFGAPDLVGEFWWLMVQELSRQGLREIRGDLIADDTYFDSEERPDTVPDDSWVSAPVSALSFNYDVVTVRVRPGPTAGSRPSVELIPLGSYFKVNNRALTRAGTSRLVVGRGYRQGVNTIDVSGSIRLGSSPIEVTKGVEEPALYALAGFKELATKQGIAIRGAMRKGETPPGALELFRFESKPLASIVRDMNKHSNNFIAEAILKTLGAEFVGTPGTTEKGLEVVREFLSRIGVPHQEILLADGSGLSHQNRTTARALVQTLRAMHDDFELWPEFLASLPIAGVDGTLQRRFRAEDLLRKVRAKTGKIAGVTSLSGYAVNEGGETFAFSIVLNDYRCGTETIKRLTDRVCSALVESGPVTGAPATATGFDPPPRP
jgi:D-alanyl-D-alanine carboxypeptidase/D-alanyl-D-alanine-endopeptidase (penicillin-binding protein 4)